MTRKGPKQVMFWTPDVTKDDRTFPGGNRTDRRLTCCHLTVAGEIFQPTLIRTRGRHDEVTTGRISNRKANVGLENGKPPCRVIA